MSYAKIKLSEMVSLAFIIFFALFIIRCTDSNSSNNAAKDKHQMISNDSTKIVLQTELPAPNVCNSDLGVLKMDANGNSIGKKTELTELRKLLKDKKCDIIEINYKWSSSNYDDMPKKIVYNRRDGKLKDIYTKTNVIEEYSGVDEVGLKKFLDKGKKSFYLLSDYTNSKYDFNNREMKQKAAVGKRPSQSEWDGSVKVVEDYIKSNSKDASSIKFLEWSKVIPFDEFWIVRCKFKGTNSFGGVVTENMWFYIQNEKIVNTKAL